MNFLNTKSIMFRIAVMYILVTLLNVTVFNVMVWENQTGLIMDNAILSSQHKGSAIKYRIESEISKFGDLTATAINAILRGANELNIHDISIFSETGKLFVSVVANKTVNREKASIDELRMINMAITKQDFEKKLFYHKVNKKERRITLYIPFEYSGSQIGVTSIDLEMQDINRQMRFLYKQCILIGLLIIFIHTVFAIIISKMLLIPLRQIIDATQEVATGHFDVRIPIVSQDELGILASSFNEMSIGLSRIRDEDRGANPLTGLPGNVTIANTIDQKLAQNLAICVQYCDLDNFKAYNDKYGFIKGDEAILYTKECLLQVAKRNDLHDVFVGHEGGDDFVVITPYDCWENFAKSFVTIFDRGIYQFYNSQDARNGFIESVNRKGARQRFPLMSISIAIVTNYTRPFTRHAEIIQVAAEVKKYVKSLDGSCYALDRRTEPVSQVSTASPQSGRQNSQNSGVA